MDRKVVNINVGLLGHIDCGKTSLARSLSSKMSTACFDKHPQSQERGITLDLGFSACFVSAPDHLKTIYPSLEQLQVTLVDCPGHASLIKTIISGSQIIDLMLLVVDVTKGMQTQTAECLIIGEITCNRMIVVLNKVDLLPSSAKEEAISKMNRRMRKTLEKTKFSKAQIIPVSAAKSMETLDRNSWGLGGLIEAIKMEIKSIDRIYSGPFMCAVDHCFSIKGQGTVLTGTVIQGSIKVNDTIEIASLQIQRKVKSIQMFKEPINQAIQGDRIGICVTQFDSKSLERGIVSAPGYLEQSFALIVKLKKIPYYKGNIENKSKFHVTIFHETVLGRIELFTSSAGEPFDISKDYLACDSFDSVNDENSDQASPKEEKQIFALIHLERPIIASQRCLMIASKLDTNVNVNICRLAFHGTVEMTITNKDYQDSWLPSLRIYKIKTKKGIIDRIPSEYEAIANIFKKETDLSKFQGLKVELSTGEMGLIDGSFGQKGKVKIRLPDGINDKSLISRSAKKGNKADTEITLTMQFKRYVHDKEKKIIHM